VLNSFPFCYLLYAFSNTFVKMGGFCVLIELIQVSGIEYLSSSSQPMLLSVFL